MAERGGKREGAGRPKGSKAENNVKEEISKAIEASGGESVLTEIWQKILEKAKQGSEKHAQIFLNYYYGKPVDNINVQGGMVMTFTRKVVK